MVSALNMELEMIRTVLSNDMCEVGVAADMKRDTGVYYTVVSVFSRPAAKELAERIAVSGVFGQNRDFIGSFTRKDALCLVFAYQPESSLRSQEELYATSFQKRKEIALNFLAALAETECDGDIGKLLIHGRNVNLLPDGKVSLNYFLDFSEFTPSRDSDSFFRGAADFAFGILAREYELRYGGQWGRYPYELRLMYKKLTNKGFRSISQIISFVRGLPDKPTEQRFGLMRLAGPALRVKAFLLRDPTHLFLMVIVLVTLGYLGYQLGIRLAASAGAKENTVYVGMERIGEVYLGEEAL